MPELSDLPLNANPLTTIVKEDPTVIRLLKRELSVALDEEDYQTASQIRDHPLMILYMEMIHHSQKGEEEKAQELKAQLIKSVLDLEDKEAALSTTKEESEPPSTLP